MIISLSLSRAFFPQWSYWKRKQLGNDHEDVDHWTDDCHGSVCFPLTRNRQALHRLFSCFQSICLRKSLVISLLSTRLFLSFVLYSSIHSSFALIFSLAFFLLRLRLLCHIMDFLSLVCVYVCVRIKLTCKQLAYASSQFQMQNQIRCCSLVFLFSTDLSTVFN